MLMAITFVSVTAQVQLSTRELIGDANTLLSSLHHEHRFRGAVVGIFSMVSMGKSQIAVRDSLRATWGSHPAVQLGTDKSSVSSRDDALRVVFVCGTQPSMMSGKHQREADEAGGAFETPTADWLHAVAQLRVENETHGDIVLLDAVEDSRNFRKTGVWLTYAANNFPHAAYIARADDDVFLRPLCLANVVSRMPSSAFFWGWPAYGASQSDPLHELDIVRTHDYSSTQRQPNGCEPYANGGFIWVSRDVATRIADRDFYADATYPFLGEDLIFSCFVASVLSTPSTLQTLVGGGGGSGSSGAAGNSNGGEGGAPPTPPWHSRDSGIFAEAVYGHSIGRNSIVIHAKNLVKRRFESRFYASKILRKLGIVLASDGPHAQLKLIDASSSITNSISSSAGEPFGGGDLPTTVVAWNNAVGKLVGLAEELRDARLREEEIFSREPQRLAALTVSENVVRASARDVETFVLRCIVSVRTALGEVAASGYGTHFSYAALGKVSAFDACGGVVPTLSSGVSSIATAASSAIGRFLATSEIAFAELHRLANAYNTSAADVRTLFDELALKYSGAEEDCPVPPRSSSPSRSSSSSSRCAWDGRFVHLVDSSSTRVYSASSTIHIDDKSWSLNAFDCDAATAWRSEWLRGDAQCAPHPRAVELPQWVAFPSSSVGVSTGRRVLRSFSIRAIDAAGMMVGGEGGAQCGDVSPREWRLEARPRRESEAMARWAASARVHMRGSSSAGARRSSSWFPVAQGVETTPWACSEVRRFAVNAAVNSIDLNTHDVRFVVHAVGVEGRGCAESFVAIADLDLEYDTIVDDDYDL